MRNLKTIVVAENYGNVDGASAYQSTIDQLTIGEPQLEVNQTSQIAVQIWEKACDDSVNLKQELPIHQVFDLMILVSQTLLHFKEAYRQPLLYDPEQTVLDKVGLQGDFLPISINFENPNLNQAIQLFANNLSDLDELLSERQNILRRILAEVEQF